MSNDEYVEQVRSDIITLFKNENADEGHAFPSRVFMSNYIPNYNPKQNAAMDEAFQGLIDDGILEERKSNFFLTAKGVEDIY